MTRCEISQEWKEKKRLQRRVIAAKKILSEMDQGHVLEGLLSGDKVQKASLAEQIGSIDFQLFRHAMHSVSRPIGRCRLLTTFSVLPKSFSREADLCCNFSLNRCQ